MKTCNKCNENREDDDFFFKIKSKNRRKNICRFCERVYKVAYYNRNKEEYKLKNKKQWDSLKALIQENKTPCIVCGESEKICLDYHHLGNKDFTLSQGHKTGSIKKIREEIAKCIILCSNCHRKFHGGIINVNVAQR